MSFDPNTELLEMYYEKGLDEGLSPEDAGLFAKEQLANNSLNSLMSTLIGSLKRSI